MKKASFAKKDRKKPFAHDWAGQASPIRDGFRKDRVFTVGVFQYLPGQNNGLRRSEIVVRVKGPVHASETVFKKAEEVCDCLDRGEFPTGKEITVGNEIEA